METRLLPQTWSTARLTIRDATEQDLPELRQAHVESEVLIRQLQNEDISDETMLLELRGEALPPGGERERQRLQVILDTHKGDMAGYLISYHGYPDSETFWIGSLAVRPAYQRQKLGSEIIRALTKQVRELGSYTKIGIGVVVGNDPAMAFWSSCGFTDIVKTTHHGTYSTATILKQLVAEESV